MAHPGVKKNVLATNTNTIVTHNCKFRLNLSHTEVEAVYIYDIQIVNVNTIQ